MITLSKNQAIHLHKLLLTNTGGLDGVRDEGLLESALTNPLQVFDGVDLYPSVAAKIARTCFGIICNHPFVDGNKRVGTYIMLILLELNGIEADFSDNDIVRIGLEIANGDMSDNQLLDLILSRTE